jgi:predicted DNA-binding transcriptional regulator YafY
MRASRLVSIVLLLQARGRLTAAQLATELEVSVRTVYRDVESLHTAGIPLYGDAGRWYLVAGPGPRTYRVDQILDLTALAESFTIPENFSLAGYWQSYTADFLAGLHRADAVVRLSPGAAARLTGRDADAIAETGTREPDSWTRAVLPIESVDLAVRGFLTPDIEVLEPPELRAQVAARARAIAALY